MLDGLLGSSLNQEDVTLLCWSWQQTYTGKKRLKYLKRRGLERLATFPIRDRGSFTPSAASGSDSAGLTFICKCNFWLAESELHTVYIYCILQRLTRINILNKFFPFQDYISGIILYLLSSSIGKTRS